MNCGRHASSKGPASVKSLCAAMAFVLAFPSAARADGRGASADTGLVLVDIFLNLFALGVQAAVLEDAARHPPPPQPEPTLAQRYPDDDTPRYWRRRREPQARQGLLLSFGVGGSSLWVSDQGRQRTGAFDLDFRLGYGFNDRFQMFMDIAADSGTHPNGNELAAWTFTFRGQTVLIGDRAGNGLNLNFGVGLGGVTYNSGYFDQTSTPTGLVFAGGLSYDARLTPWFSLSPELFVTHNSIPAGAGYNQDVIATAYGLRLNFLWYLH